MGSITVAIPVGPEKHHQAYLEECLASVAEQTVKPDEVLLIDDMAGLPWRMDCRQGSFPPQEDYVVNVWRSPWRLGVGQAFNFGVALAENDLVFMLGGDDKLLPRCLEECLAAYEKHHRTDRYYGVGVEYSDDREDQYLLCNAAMVTKGFWKLTGGFPLESASGAPDAALISILSVNGLPSSVIVNETEPLYWYRVHDECDTAQRGPWQGVIIETRDLLTKLWKPPAWGRYS